MAMAPPCESPTLPSSSPVVIPGRRITVPLLTISDIKRVRMPSFHLSRRWMAALCVFGILVYQFTRSLESTASYSSAADLDSPWNFLSSSWLNDLSDNTTINNDDDNNYNVTTFSSSSSSIAATADDWKRAYEFALARYRERRQRRRHGDNRTVVEEFWDLHAERQALYRDDKRQRNKKGGGGVLVHSIRIPKAGSSYLSVTARALAGCLPDGFPCCGYAPRRREACPRPGLGCPHRVRGCTGHDPSFVVEKNPRLPCLTGLRHPVGRLVSGFFYGGMHRPRGRDTGWTTFEHRYVTVSRFRNVQTKMLAGGDFAYAPYDETRHTAARAEARLCRHVHWFSVTDALPVLSQILLYERPYFRDLVPNPVVFQQPALPGRGVSSEADDNKPNNKNTTTTTGLRSQQGNVRYAAFRQLVQTGNGTRLIHEYNREDARLYDFAVALQCARLRPLWSAWRDFVNDDADALRDEWAVCQRLWTSSSSSGRQTEDELCAASQNVTF